jgi:hypothetical protein
MREQWEFQYTRDQRRVNGAIIERWSLHALEWIKTQAHSGRCFDG